MSDNAFKELASAEVNVAKELVISERNKGGFTIGQRILVQDGKKKIGMFLKGAIYVKGLDELINVRDALNLAISKAEKQNNVENDDEE
jgi:hypothetical protein